MDAVTNGGTILFTLFGPQLFTGTVSAPAFSTGPFTLYTNVYLDTLAGDLLITALPDATLPPSGVPEPAMLALMLIGIGAVGGTSRYRRRKAMVART